MKNYLIIGASSGIGKALVKELAVNDNQIFCTYNSNKTEDFGHVHYHELDVTSDFDLDFLPDQLDGLVYCPGTINLKPFKRLKPSDFIEDINLQVIGAIKVIQAVLPLLKKAENASILLFSTVAVQSGFNFHSQVSVSKGAIEGLTKSLAAEFAPTIRVNAIAPSLTDTPLSAGLLNTDQKREANANRHPLKRIGTAEDIARAAAFLISEKASWISGQIIHVDGGMSSLKI
ncbi:MAG: NAD(P)-dependent dehydrogenase (short-subunit alcohol dehydrogenase family) [Arenicella sp.]|jgi:NAD(P)-dependent dehydrogenase (short-subunit alcohol dehydrogenase family)